MDSRFKTAMIAIFATASASSGPAQAQADTWPCEVMLCMASPGGPTQFSECAEPIKRLVRHLALGGSFPVCRAPGLDPIAYEESGSGDIRLVFPDGSVRYFRRTPVRSSTNAPTQGRAVIEP
ncbi:MAG: hypothetical protein AAF692_02270 [Pseudomonadota bacterium]